MENAPGCFLSTSVTEPVICLPRPVTNHLYHERSQTVALTSTLGLSFQKSFGEILTRLGSLGVKCDIERFIFIASADGCRRRVGVEGVRRWSLSQAPGWNWKGAFCVKPGEPVSFITGLDYKIEEFTEWSRPCMWSWLRGPSGATEHLICPYSPWHRTHGPAPSPDLAWHYRPLYAL